MNGQMWNTLHRTEGALTPGLNTSDPQCRAGKVGSGVFWRSTAALEWAPAQEFNVDMTYDQWKTFSQQSQEQWQQRAHSGPMHQPQVTQDG